MASQTPQGIPMADDDVVMPVVPMFHVNAWGMPFTATAGGAKQVFPGPSPEPEDLATLIEDEGVTISAGVPTVWLGLLEYVDVTDGLDEDGVVLINTGADPEEVDVETEAEVVTVDATEIALDHLGKPIMNTALLGAFAGATGLIEQESVEEVIEREWGGEIGQQNVAASTDAFAEVQA